MHSKGNKGTKAFSKTAAACILTMGLVGSPYAMAIADPGENEGQSIAQSEKIDKGSTTADSLPSVDPALMQSEASDGGDSGSSVAQSDSLIEDTEKSHIYSDITDDEVLDALSPIDEPSATLFQSESDQSDPVTVFAGEDRYDTSAKQALGGWDSCGTVLVVSGGGWPDALGASGLAGALDCPILLTDPGSLPSSVAQAIAELGATHAIVVGGQTAVSEQVVSDLKAAGAASVERLGGDTRYGTQMEIYRYGKERSLWGGSTAIVANGSGSNFADALSASPVAFAEKAPIFITNEDGRLPLEQQKALISGASDGDFSNMVLVGGSSRIDEFTEGFANSVGSIASKKSGSYSCDRLAGETRYETSAKLASWAVSKGILSADGAGFASASSPYDALGGGALQGHRGSVLLLVNDGSYSAAVGSLSSGGVGSISFFGGDNAISANTREGIAGALGISVDKSVTYRNYDITLSSFAKLEGLSADEIDPNNWSYGDSGFYQFANIGQGSSGKVSADQLNSYFAAKVGNQERNYNCSSRLRGLGQAFIGAADKYKVNEVYLASHAALESAWGCSVLAQGWTFNDDIKDAQGNILIKATGKTYYNFFGIGAYDNSPIDGGRLMAVKQGWDSPEAAVYGAAKWISENYVHSPASKFGPQDTLYKMRHDVQRAAAGQKPWHEYATSKTWATGIASVMANCYSYMGYDMRHSGLVFEVPRFK